MRVWLSSLNIWRRAAWRRRSGVGAIRGRRVTDVTPLVPAKLGTVVLSVVEAVALAPG
jgi:hypothetical protein